MKAGECSSESALSYWSEPASQNSEANFAVEGVSQPLQGDSELNFAVDEPRFANSENQFAALSRSLQSPLPQRIWLRKIAKLVRYFTDGPNE